MLTNINALSMIAVAAVALGPVYSYDYETIKGCVGLQQYDNYSQTQSTSMHLSEGHYLYEVTPDVNWCDAYHFCISKGKNLATIKDKNKQNALISNLDDIKQYIWIGGRRKDFGHKWTWVNHSLTEQNIEHMDYGLKTRSPQSGATVYVRQENNSYNYAVSNENSGDQCFCAVNDIISVKTGENVTTWMTAQNMCHEEGGRLATLDEVCSANLENELHSNREIWIGLYRNPWMWIENDNSTNARYSPVLYSAWEDMSNPEESCMALLNTRWKDVPCNARTQYILCQDKSLHSKENDDNNREGINQSDGTDQKTPNGLTNSQKAIIAVTVVMILLICAIILCVLAKRGVCRSETPYWGCVSVVYRSATSRGPANQEQGNVPNKSCKVEMAAYKPESSRHKLSRKSKNSLPQNNTNDVNVNKASSSHTLPKLNKGVRKHTASINPEMYEDIDGATGTSATFRVSPGSAVGKKNPDSPEMYSVVNKIRALGSGRVVASTTGGDPDDDVTIVDNEMYCDAEMTPDGLNDDVIIVENENYGDVESPYEFAKSLLEKKPAPAPKPVSGLRQKMSQIPHKNHTIGVVGRGARPKDSSALRDIPALQEPPDVYAEVDRSKKSKSFQLKQSH